MKDEENPAPKRRQLVGRNEFPPFKRNQIRWALHCYRWKHGISWEKYPYEIAHALGIPELGDGLNSRDPRGFVLEGQTPTPEKLRLYERFIEKVAPEYAKAFTEDDFTSTLANYVSRYLNSPRDLADQTSVLMEAADSLEHLVYIQPFPGMKNFSEMNGVFRILTVRKFGDGPYLRVAMFGVNLSKSIREWLSDFHSTTRRESVGIDESSLDEQSFIFDRMHELLFGDSLCIRNLRTGLAVPFSNGHHYLCLFRDAIFRTFIAQLSPCAITCSSMEDLESTAYYGRADSMIKDVSVVFAVHEDTGRPRPQVFMMRGHAHNSAQEFMFNISQFDITGIKDREA